MKKQTLATILMSVAAVTIVGLIVAIRQTGNEKPQRSEDINLDDEAEDDDYVTYAADFEDGYKMYFDYVDGFTELKGIELGGMVSKKFGLGTIFITATHVPAIFNNKDMPRTAEEYIDTASDADFCDALPYVNGDTKGFAYWEESQTSGYNMGYEIFEGNEYFNIFVHGSGIWPANIKNVRIVKE